MLSGGEFRAMSAKSSFKNSSGSVPGGNQNAGFNRGTGNLNQAFYDNSRKFVEDLNNAWRHTSAIETC
jgi:hypothetical protein